jgi:hypothetical protein
MVQEVTSPEFRTNSLNHGLPQDILFDEPRSLQDDIVQSSSGRGCDEVESLTSNHTLLKYMVFFIPYSLHTPGVYGGSLELK